MDLRTQVATALGCDPAKLTDQMVKEIARSLKLAVPREVKIVQNDNGHMYVSTEAFTVPGKTADKPAQARPIYLRVEALDQAIEDLLAAKGILAAAKK